MSWGVLLQMNSSDADCNVGELQPVIVTLPPLEDDEELEMDIDEPPMVESEVKKGKRKA